MTPPSREQVCLYALTKIKGVGLLSARRMINFSGSAEALWDNPKILTRLSPQIYLKLHHALSDHTLLRVAEDELRLTSQREGVEMVGIFEEHYPPLLRECIDAPLLLFYCGNISALHLPQILSVVGTRKPSVYGVEQTQAILSTLPNVAGQVCIVSGLAFGIDVAAHRAALQCGLPTVAVLAHGLQMVYPSVHSSVAREIVSKGGCLISEYPVGVKPERNFFVARNRIVAGLSHATLVAQSAEKGGSLITAHLAFDYDRSVYAVPGRPSDEESAGCNRLIYDNVAKIISSASQLCQDMQWSAKITPSKSEKSVPLSKQSEINAIRSQLDSEGKLIFDKIIEHPEGMTLDMLSEELLLPIDQLTYQLFLIESYGGISVQAGGLYMSTIL